MKTIRDVDVKEKRILLRCDLNCPINESGDIIDDFRIRKAIPTIEYLLSKDAKIILMSHLDDPKGEIIEKLRLNNVQEELFKHLDLSILKAPDCVGDNVKKIADEMRPCEVLLLENLRFHKEEEENDNNFAKELASLGDIFVNDAFGASHRAHASIVGVPKFLPSFAGILLGKEVKTLKSILEKPKKPLVGIFGGVKIDTKLPIIQKFLNIADFVLIGGKIANEIKFSNSKLVAAECEGHGFDINKESIEKFKKIIRKAGTIVWNGPLGYFEKQEYEKGTKEIAEAIAESKAFKVLGGGETLFAASKYDLENKVDFLSTGGGAMLEFLAGDKLPGLKPIL